MPQCENTECARELAPEEVTEGKDRRLYCSPCSGTLVLGREFDYSINYTRDQGLRAGIRLGGASLSFEVNSDELNRTFGSAQ